MRGSDAPVPVEMFLDSYLRFDKVTQLANKSIQSTNNCTRRKSIVQERHNVVGVNAAFPVEEWLA